MKRNFFSVVTESYTLHRKLSMSILDKIKKYVCSRYCPDSGQEQILREKFKNRENIQDLILRIFPNFFPVYYSRISWKRSSVFVFNTFHVFLSYECIQLLLKSSSQFLNSKLHQIWSRSNIKTLFIYTKLKKCIKESTPYGLLLQNTYVTEMKIQKLVSEMLEEKII